MIQQIDIRKTIQEKNPILAYIPFLVQWMKKIVHEKEINEFLLRYGHLQGIEFAKSAIEFLNVQVQIKGGYPPPNGRYIFVSNHPLGGLDGIIFMCVIGAAFPNIKFPVNDILYAIENLHSIFLPINKHGKPKPGSHEQIRDAYKSTDQVLIFPAGMVSRKEENKAPSDLFWSPSFITKSVRYERDIIPVYISGENSWLFYTIANIRKNLGIKQNLEMTLLPRELFLQQDKEVEMHMGERIPHTLFKKKENMCWAESAEFWAEYVRKEVYKLPL